jgi:cytochrome c
MMNRSIYKILIIVLLFAFLLSKPTRLRAEEFSELESRGFTLASRYCSACHAITRSDVSPYAKAPPFRTLGRHYPVESLAEALAEGIIVGHAEMSEFKFHPDDIGALIAYLKYVQEPATR